MKVAIIGATGNAGTALLRALHAADEISEIVGVARRVPSPEQQRETVYQGVRWEQYDVGLPVIDEHAEEILTRQLSKILTGVDAVVHLAWQIQPNRHRSVLRRTNVAGTWRVVRACARAGVPRLVAASSVGAYSPAQGDSPRDETWPAGGVPGSHYSVDKAAQERVLDYAEELGLSVARMRPALIFDAEAASEVLRLFIGAALPPGLLRPGVPPVLPMIKGLRLQVVNGRDAADAYKRALLTGANGAFNIAADEVLWAEDLAEEIDRGRLVEMSQNVVRRAVAIGWKSGLVAADPGWVDMAMSVPVMDSSRARRELGWSPQYGACETLRELLTAIADGTGYPGTKLRPHRRWPADQLPDGSAIGRRLRHWPGKRVGGQINPRKLGVYLADHIAGATAGYGQMRLLAEKCLENDRLRTIGEELSEMADQLKTERALIGELMDSLELPRRRWRAAVIAVSHRAAGLGESASTEVSLTRSSPALGVLDVEVLRGAVAAKLGGWQSLADLAPELGAPRELFEYMAQRGQQQLSKLEQIHGRLRQQEFFFDDREHG